MTRSILAVVGGLFAGFFLILAFEMLSQLIYPPPPWMKMDDPKSIAEAVKQAPTGAFVLVLISWALGTFIAAGIAARIAPGAKMAYGLSIGAVFLIAGIMNMSMFPHPVWMWVIGLAEFLPVAYLGARLVTIGQSQPATVPE
jgi:hypothetical protein